MTFLINLLCDPLFHVLAIAGLIALLA